MFDVNHIEVLPELLTLSFNFKEPIGVLVDGETPFTITGIVETIGERSIKLEGQWIKLSNILGVEP